MKKVENKVEMVFALFFCFADDQQIVEVKDDPDAPSSEKGGDGLRDHCENEWGCR